MAKKKIKEESQKGSIASGRVLADIIEKDSNQTEKKFLHDFSYNLFEDTLIKEGRVLEINDKNIEDQMTEMGSYSFVKISGNVIFNDLKVVEDTIRNFNNIGEALGYIIHKSNHDEEVKELNEKIKILDDREQKAKLRAILKSKTDFKKVLKEMNLNYDEKYLEKLAYLLAYGYKQQFEVQMPIFSYLENLYLFSSQLNRKNLKEDESSIISKYSRETEKEFKLFGIITQRLNSEEKREVYENLIIKEEDEEGNLKEAIRRTTSALTNVEETFTGKFDYEYIIDPIALYLEI
ncbi:hypothetical protein ACE193_11255 [Bernardetia sp. OM2101]|uniref:hypothetical protein n=1 Tax=Bernardetia sp. OM2101 TaxID=3344876 RepID=UPI0035CFDB07